MKPFITGILILAGCLLMFTACSDDKNPVQQYGNAMTQSLNSAKNAENKAHADAARKAIQDFHTANGRFPVDLAELSSSSGIPLKSETFAYNPENGTLTVK